jgi:hypothetical protein
MASLSSALLDLSMQQVSTQKYCRPSQAACALPKFYLLVASLVAACAFVKVFKCNFVSVRTPGVRKDSIARDIVIVLFHQNQVPVSIMF